MKWWKMILNKAAQSAEIMIYEMIGKDWWSDEGVAAKDFAADLKALGDVTEISLRINSPGGSVFEGLVIHNLLQAHPANVTVYIDGLAASIASVIAMCGNKIVMPENAMIMIHDPSAVVMGNSEDMRKMAEMLDKVKCSIQTAYKRTKMTEDEISAMMTAETWLTAAEAVEKGFCDEIVEAVKMAASFDLSPFRNAPSALKNIINKTPDIKVQATPKEVVQMEKCTVCGATLADGKCPHCMAKAQVAQDNKTRVADIRAMAEKYNMAQLGIEYIQDGKSVQEFQAAILEKMGHSKAEPINVYMSDQEQTGYSVARAILSVADKSQSFEREISNQIAATLKRGTNGIFIPMRIKNTALTTTAGEGGYTVGTQVGELIDILRNKMMVKAMGARVMSGLTGNIGFPRKSATSVLYWTGENPNAAVTQGDMAFEQLLLSPKTAQATTQFSRQLLIQSSIDAEALVRDDLMAVNAVGIDSAAINGTGQNSQPTGILATVGIGAVAGGTDGAVPTWANVVALESKIVTANADFGTMGYLTTPKARGILKTTPKFTSTGTPIWEKGVGEFGEMNGYKAAASSQVPSNLVKGNSGAVCSAIVFGNWNDLLIGEFGVIELTVDPYTLADKGLIKVTSHVMIDLGVRHAASFAAMKDALTTGQ